MEDNFVKYPEINGIYEHYKGGKYKVITLAKHSETDETMVVYESLLFGSVHVRPLSMWFDDVTRTRDGVTCKNISRFTFTWKYSSKGTDDTGPH